MLTATWSICNSFTNHWLATVVAVCVVAVLKKLLLYHALPVPAVCGDILFDYVLFLVVNLVMIR